MKLNKGLFTAVTPIDQPDGTWSDGRNAVARHNVIINECGFEIVTVLGGIAMGNIVIDGDIIVVFQIRGALSEIYEVDLGKNAFRRIASTVEFDFDVNHPITGEYYRDSKGNIVIAFTDNNKYPRVLNTTVDYGTAIEKLTRLYLSYKTARLFSYEVRDTGGALDAGAYFVSFAYESIDKSITPYSTLLGPFYVTQSLSSSSIDDYVGSEAGAGTSKSLHLVFDNLDTDYKYLIVVLTSKIDGIVTSKTVKRVIIPSTAQIEVDIYGTEDEGVVTLAELVEGVDVYSKVKCMAQLNNVLYMANLSKDEDISYQLAALDAKVDYVLQEVDITATNNKNPKLLPERSLMANEVYMLNLHFVKTDGTVTRGFHLPGRAPALYGGTLGEFTGQMENALITGTGAHLTRAKNISNNKGRIFHFFETADNGASPSNMGFWQNKETYPDMAEFGSLRNMPIRHHRTPSLSHIKRRYYPSDHAFGTRKLPKIGIKISGVIMPPDTIGYYVSVAKRTIANSTILAQDMLLRAGKKDGETKIWNTGGNWNLDAYTKQSLSIDNNYLRFHAFDLLVDKPGISPNYLEYELTLRKPNLNHRPYNFTTDKGIIIMTSGGETDGDKIEELNGRIVSADERRQDIVVLDYTDTDVLVEAVAERDKSVRISGFKYLPNNVESGLGDYTNLGAEEVAVAKIEENNVYKNSDLKIMTSIKEKGRNFKLFKNGTGGGANSQEVTHTINIKQFKEDMYPDLFGQELYLLTKQMIINSGTNTIFGGDILQSDYSFVTYAPNSGEDTNPAWGIRVLRRQLVESVHFASYRYEETTASQFFPKTSAFPYLMDLRRDGNYNKWLYNKDYSAVNDLNLLAVDDPIENLEFNDRFPYRIIRSRVSQLEENGLNSWRTFPVRDYYEMPKNRGEINNLAATEFLLIHQRAALSRTRNNVKLASSEGEVTAGTGDIFALEPQELLYTKEGHAGLQHRFAALLTKAGYFFVDAEQGKVFLLTGSLNEISDEGNREFFFNNLSGAEDNPYITSGFTIGYDEEYNRIILSKSGTNPFTLSYSMEIRNGQSIGAWAFFHDYLPNMMFHTRIGLYSFKNSVIYKHNIPTVKGKYYGSTIYPTYIVPTFNTPNAIKYFYNLWWKSEVHRLDGANQDKETLTHIFMWNSKQATNEIPLALLEDLTYNTYNLRKTAGVWHFNKFRDLVRDNKEVFQRNSLPVTSNINLSKNFYEKRRFIDHYLLVKFKYDNQPIAGQQRNLYLYEVDVEIKPVER